FGPLDGVAPEEQLVEDLALGPVVLDEVQAQAAVKPLELAAHPGEVGGDIQCERVQLFGGLDRLRERDRFGAQFKQSADLLGDVLLLELERLAASGRIGVGLRSEER